MTGITYDERRLDHVAALQERLPGEVGKRHWSAAQLAAERLERLRGLLNHAKAHSPWHAERLRDVEPREVTEEGLRTLPTMSKDDLMTHWDDIVCDRRLTLRMAEEAIDRARAGEPTYLFGQHQALASGGSSGRRGVFVWDWEGLAIGVASPFASSSG